jgi:hybrid cluster-associated redox disulfide protein
MPTPLIDADSTVRAVMDAWPETVSVFMARRMHCPGCVMSRFMTVGEAATSYRIAPADLVADLRAAASRAEPAGEPGDRT